MRGSDLDCEFSGPAGVRGSDLDCGFLIVAHICLIGSSVVAHIFH